MLRAMYMVAFCLGLRMHEGQNRVPGSIQKSAKLGYMTAICAWLTMHLATIACRECYGVAEFTEFSLRSGCDWSNG